VNAARAIAAGLSSGHTSSNPGYWLHTGGTGILTYFDSRDGKLGENSEKVFNDFEGVDELVNLPSEAFHRNVDEIVLDCGSKEGDKVKTALVCPPTIYGMSMLLLTSSPASRRPSTNNEKEMDEAPPSPVAAKSTSSPN
jgi:hypothetical protein